MIGEERDEDVRFNARFLLVIDRPHREVVLEFLEGLLDFGELDVERPKLLGCLPTVSFYPLMYRPETASSSWPWRTKPGILAAGRSGHAARHLRRSYRIASPLQPELFAMPLKVNPMGPERFVYRAQNVSVGQIQ